MRHLLRGLIGLYRAMVRLYPRGIREEYGQEMIDVFRDSVRHVAPSGFSSIFRLISRELLDWPSVLFQAHLDSLRGISLIEMMPLPLSSLTAAHEKDWIMKEGNDISTMSKRQMIRSALPPLLLGLGIMGSAMVRTDVWYRLPRWQLYLSGTVVLLSGLVVGAVTLIVLFRGLPDWGLTWLGTAFMGFTLFTQVLTGEAAEEGWFSISATLEAALGLGFFFSGVLLLTMIADQGLPQAGLFTMAAAGTLGLSLLQGVTAAPFNRDDIALLAGPLGLLFASLIFLYIRRSGWERIAAFTVLGLSNIGIAIIANQAWGSWLEERGAPSPLLPLLVLITGLLISGPVFGKLLPPIKRKVLGSGS